METQNPKSSRPIYSVLAGVICFALLSAAYYFLTGAHTSSQTNSHHASAPANANAPSSPRVKPQEFTLTSSGVGSLQIKKPFTDMSASDEGLYNRVEKVKRDWDNDTYYDVYLYWDDNMIASLSFYEAKPIPEYIIFYTDRITLPQGLKTGMPIKEAIEKGLDFRVQEDMEGSISETGYYANMQIGPYECNTFMNISPEIFTKKAWERIINEISTNLGTSNLVHSEDIATEKFVLENIVVGNFTPMFW